VRSVTTERFRLLFAAASPARQSRIRAAYLHWTQNPAHPSLRFKKVHPHLPIFSARVDLDWRAVGVLEADTLVWFWVGPHPQYEALLKSL
jgi:hypothetical protein